MKLIGIIEKVEKVLMAILFTIMVVCVFAQVLNRNLIQAGVSWFEELSRYCMVYMTILGAEIGLRDGTQLAIDAFKNGMSAKVQKALNYLSNIIIVVFSGVVFVNSIGLFEMFISSAQKTTALKISTAVPFSAVPVGMFLICLTQIITLAYRIHNDFHNASEKGENEE